METKNSYRLISNTYNIFDVVSTRFDYISLLRNLIPGINQLDILFPLKPKAPI